MQIADTAADLDVVRIPLGTADLMLAADLAVGCAPGVLERNAKSAAVIGNLDLAATAEFKRTRVCRSTPCCIAAPSRKPPTPVARSGCTACALPRRLFGNAQAMNTLLLGLAWQRGLVPVGEAAILRAIELNGAAVTLNQRAFLWGRILAEQPELADEILRPTRVIRASDIEELIGGARGGAGAVPVAALCRRAIAR